MPVPDVSSTSTTEPKAAKKKTKGKSSKKDEQEVPDNAVDVAELPGEVKDKAEGKEEKRREKKSKKRKHSGDEDERVKDADGQTTTTADGAGADVSKEEGKREEEEVEAVSHKERRKRKKLEAKGLLPDASGKDAEETKKESSSIANVSERPQRSGHCAWVGNLAFSTTPQRVQDFFKQCGTITRLHMPVGTRRGEQNRGFAYVDFDTDEAKQKALALTEHNLDGRRLLIKEGSDFTGRPAPSADAVAAAASATEMVSGSAGAVERSSKMNEGTNTGGKTGLTKTAQKVLRAQKNPPSSTLFVGNLSFETEEQNIWDLFERSASEARKWAKKDREERRERRKRKVAKGKKGDEGEEETSESEDEESESASEEEEQRQDGEGEGGNAGIRKVRMGTFEDSGKCKGFAFVDFHAVPQATAALINPRNKWLLGRGIVLQYAGAAATRRSGYSTEGPRAAVKGKGRLQKRERRAARYGSGEAEDGREDGMDDEEPKDSEAAQSDRRRNQRQDKHSYRRPKPGAALAKAPRATAGIVESTGTKITFD